MNKSFSLLILFTLILTACSGGAQDITGSFAGRVEGSNAFIGLVTNGEEVMAFFCDGTTEAPPVLWGWFRGQLNRNAFDLTSENGDQLTGEFNADGASGSIALADGSALTFQVEPVNQPAGLYRHAETFDGVQNISGWIVLSNGEVRGGKRSGSQLTSAASQPTGWVDPDTEPIRWVDPDVEP
jgi:hypothetical protein